MTEDRLKTGTVRVKIWVIIVLALLIVCSGFQNRLEAADFSRLSDFHEQEQAIRVKLAAARENMVFSLKDNTKYRELETGKTEELDAGEYRLVVRASETETVYFVQVLAAEAEYRAEEMKEELNMQGFYDVRIEYEDELYKVQVGSESSRQDTSRLKNELEQAGFPGWIGNREDGRNKYLVLEKLEGDSSREVLTTENLAVDSGFYLDGEFYPGEVEFILNEEGFKLFQEINIDFLVKNKIFQLHQQQNLNISDSAVISALNVVIRSKLLWDFIHSEQGYIETEEYRGVGRFSDNLISAVEESDDYYLNYNQELIRGYLHQNSGGITAEPESVLEDNYTDIGLSAVEDPYSPESEWSKDFSETFIQEKLLTRIVDMMPALNMVPANMRNISVDSRTSCGRVETLNIRTDYGSFNIRGSDIYALFESEDFSLPSKLFEIESEMREGSVKKFTLEGRGRGEGLGLPIESAIRMAEEQLDWREILNFFYPQANIDKLKDIFLEDQLVSARVQRGLFYSEVRHYTIFGTRVYTKLEFDLESRRLKAAPALAGGNIGSGLKDIVEVGRDVNALAGINGGFFDWQGRPLGLFIQDGEIVADISADLKRTAILFDDQNNLSIDRYDWEGRLKYNDSEIEISGVNRGAYNDEAVLINKYYGDKAPRNEATGVEMVIDENNEIKGIHRGKLSYTLSVPEDGYIIQARGKKADKLGHLTTGQTILLEDKIMPEPDFAGEVVHALGAGPRLVKNGEILITAEEEEFQRDIVEGRAPRSAVGITADNKLIMITVDGRQPHRSVGINLENLAGIMQNLGAIDAMNLDGGASARMIVRGFTMSVPSAERLVSNAIMIVPQDF